MFNLIEMNVFKTTTKNIFRFLFASVYPDFFLLLLLSSRGHLTRTHSLHSPSCSQQTIDLIYRINDWRKLHKTTWKRSNS